MLVGYDKLIRPFNYFILPFSWFISIVLALTNMTFLIKTKTIKFEKGGLDLKKVKLALHNGKVALGTRSPWALGLYGHSVTGH